MIEYTYGTGYVKPEAFDPITKAILVRHFYAEQFPTRMPAYLAAIFDDLFPERVELKGYWAEWAEGVIKYCVSDPAEHPTDHYWKIPAEDMLQPLKDD